MDDNKTTKKVNFGSRLKGGLIRVITVLVVLLILFNSFAIIPTGYTGVRTTFGQVTQETVPTGFTMKIPFVQQIIRVNNKQQDLSVANTQVWGETTEKIPVYAQYITVSFRLASDKSAYLYSNYQSMSNLISDDMAASAFKRAAVAFSVDTVTQRSEIEPKTKSELQAITDEKYGKGTISILQVVINAMDFQDSYNEAINQKNIAKQAQAKQAIENQTNIDKAKADAEAARTTAQGNADAARIEAEGKAKANALLTSSITENTLRQDEIAKWDGALPRYMGSGSGALFGVFDNENGSTGTAKTGSSTGTTAATGTEN